ncbi:hypothetical protein H2200_003355 [Cladophialophora chaetospira]|uniref:Protein kinase domain-containing protein n=1 Tax=Cladophialophora chaetospira TaxID=386627 RepID=A0AA39CMN6_9EURO|nr:hypothetical protein H2200_003355 [Cladophialophora chaetospira]
MSLEKYAVYFPELSNDCSGQSGYLWVRKLGSGIEGTVDLVLSVSDGQLYARKKTVPTRPAGADYHSREGYFHRKHPRIPELISSADCRVLRDWHKQAELIKATVTISKYCNGGTLSAFHDQCRLTQSPQHEVTEQFLWRLLVDQLDVVLFVHNSTPSLGRTDGHMNNTWLHFPGPSWKLPEFFSGDLGQLEVLNADIWQPRKARQLRRLRDRKGLRKVPRYSGYVRCLADDLNHVRVNVDVVSRAQERSEEFNKCQRQLSDIVCGLWDFCDWEDDGNDDSHLIDGSPRKIPDPRCYNKVYELRKQVKRYAERAASDDEAGVDFRWARDVPTRPRLWVDRGMLLSDCNARGMPGPFRIVKVNTTTLAITDMETTEFGANNPLKLGAYGNDLFVYGYSREELVLDPLPDQETYQQEQDDSDSADSDDENADDVPQLDEELPTHEVADLLSRIPTLKRRHGKLVADFSKFQRFRNVEVRQVKKGTLIIRLGREDFLVTKWKDGRRKKSSTRNTKATDVRRRDKPKWHRCGRHSRLHRVTDECLREEEDRS